MTKSSKKNLIKYLQSFDNKERTEEIFGISYDVLNQLIEDIRNGIDPLKDNKISNKLVEKKAIQSITILVII